MSKREGRVRSAGQVVADLARTDLPEATLRSRGTPASECEVPPPRPNTSHTPEGYRGRLVKAGEAHPYRPDEIDEWVRERCDAER